MQEKPVFKVNKVKEPLRQAKDAIEARLKEDQKRVSLYLSIIFSYLINLITFCKNKCFSLDFYCFPA
jgi:hypothetical protein